MAGHNFGRRYIKQNDFVSYAKYLGVPGSFLEHKLEFAERIGVLAPAARVRYPGSVVRRWHLDRYHNDPLVGLVEPDGPALDAANDLDKALAGDRQHETRFAWNQRHPLDRIARAHRPFVTKAFSAKTFAPWSSYRTLSKRNGHDFYLSDGVDTYYHAWQVFQFAAFLQSGLRILYDVFDNRGLESPLDLRRSDIDVTDPFPRELGMLRENERAFDAVALYCDLTSRALQVYARDRIPDTGQLTKRASQLLRTAETASARRVVAEARLKPAALIEFIGVQCELWGNAKSCHSQLIVNEYKRNVRKTIELLQVAYPRHTGSRIKKRVGGRHAWSLELMFPNWVSEQRQRVEPSLRLWIVPRLAQMPQPFTYSDPDVASFCDWIEREGFLQLYWHFNRLTDIGPFDDQIGRTAAASEVVGLASLIEHLVTHILIGRRPRPSQQTIRNTLVPKVVALLHQNHAALGHEFQTKGNFRQTTELPLRRQLARIEQARFSGPDAPVLKALLRLAVIRNAATHAGLPRFARHELQKLIEFLLIGALVVWKAQ
ncbi:MAG: hypothetical protein AB7P03_14525 [Kofleriaceae bacterium]